MPWIALFGLAVVLVVRRKRATLANGTQAATQGYRTTTTTRTDTEPQTPNEQSVSGSSSGDLSGVSNVPDWNTAWGTPNQWDTKYPTSDPSKPLTVDFDDFDPTFRAKLEAAIAAMEVQGFDPRVFEAARTQRRQAYLYGQGRTDFAGYGRTGSKVTWTLDSSYHGKYPARAADVISKAKGWSDSAFFEAWGAAVKAQGLTWGGDWKSRDMPHVQL